MLRALALALLASSLVPAAAAAAPAGLPERWEKGFNFTSWLRDEYAGDGARDSLRQLAATGANAVSVAVTWHQPSLTANEMAPDRLLTPSDGALSTVVRRAQAEGLRVTLRPMVDSAAGWRGTFRPASPRRWFARYRGMINHYADLAEDLDVAALSVGVELAALSGAAHEDEWRRLIAGVRRRFDGELVYAANWDEYRHVRWWDAVDVIGIDAYFPLSTGATPSEDEIVRRWRRFRDAEGRTHRYVDEIANVARRFDRPVLFTELGYTSSPGNLVMPWEGGTTYSADEQRRALAAAFRAFRHRPWFRGMHVWNWYANPTWGAVGYHDHSPQLKPARETLTRWFSAPSMRQAPARPAKLRVRRAQVRQGRLDALVAITQRAEGTVRVSYRSGGRTVRFARRIEGRHVRIDRRLGDRQRRRSRGVLTVAYSGTDRVAGAKVRVRAPYRSRGVRR